MARGRSSFKMGTVELIILFLLSKEDLYGYQLSTLISKLHAVPKLYRPPSRLSRYT